MRSKTKSSYIRLLCVLSIGLLAGLVLNVFASDLSAQTSRKIKYAPPVQELDDLELDDQKKPNGKTVDSDTGKPVAQLLSDETALSKPIMDIRLGVIDLAMTKPEDESNKLFEMNYATNYPNSFQHRLASWCAPNIRYQPLYFEDVALERYGYHRGDRFQPFASAMHFGKSFTLLTLNMYRQRPNSCTYPLGFCRPGGYAPQIEPKWLRR